MFMKSCFFDMFAGYVDGIDISRKRVQKSTIYKHDLPFPPFSNFEYAGKDEDYPHYDVIRQDIAARSGGLLTAHRIKHFG